MVAPEYAFNNTFAVDYDLAFVNTCIRFAAKNYALLTNFQEVEKQKLAEETYVKKRLKEIKARKK